jgi:hypothetical protein
MNSLQSKKLTKDHVDLETTIQKAINYTNLRGKDYLIVYRKKQKIYDFMTEEMTKLCREEISILDSASRIMVMRNINDKTTKKV